MKSFFTNIVATLTLILGKMISLFFVKITISSAENLSDISTFETLRHRILNDVRLEFFSRKFEVTYARERTTTDGAYLCKKDFYYYVSVQYDGPYANVFDNRGLFRLNESVKTNQEESYISFVKHMDVYIPFWRFKKEKNLVNDYIDEIKKIATRQVFSDKMELKDVDITKYNQEDYKNFDNLLEQSIKNCKTDQPYLSLITKHPSNIIQRIAKDKNMNVFIVFEYLSASINEGFFLQMLTNFVKEQKDEPFILYIDCGDDGTFMGDYFDWVTHPHYDDDSFNMLTNLMYETILSNSNYVIVLDKTGKDSNPRITSKNLKLFDLYSKKVEIAYNG